MAKKNNKLSWKIQLLMIIAGLTGWPMGLVVCYLFDGAVDENKKEALALLKEYSVACMRLEIFVLVLTGIVYLVECFC